MDVVYDYNRKGIILMSLLKKSSRLVLGLAVLGAFSMPAQAADTYKIDSSHTAVTWHINHFGFSTPSGKFMDIVGEVTLDQDNPEKSSVEVTIPITLVNTGVAKLDEHLKGADFFDVAQFPTATFVSDKVEVTGKDTAVVHGTLNLHGVQKPVALDVKVNQIGQNMFKKQTAGFTASTTIKRSDFGMVTYLPGLGDEIKIEIESEANM